ncbi:hypothetical protein NL676_003881 [Syzygium grande]|nr:hypothetical protein NL676_003881 [Syzygium grande]
MFPDQPKLLQRAGRELFPRSQTAPAFARFARFGWTHAAVCHEVSPIPRLHGRAAVNAYRYGCRAGVEWVRLRRPKHPRWSGTLGSSANNFNGLFFSIHWPGEARAGFTTLGDSM